MTAEEFGRRFEAAIEATEGKWGGSYVDQDGIGHLIPRPKSRPRTPSGTEVLMALVLRTIRPAVPELAGIQLG